MGNKQLEESRLIEITSEICKTDDLLWTMGYITTLSREDTDLLFQEVTKYIANNNASFYDALISFSKDYLQQRGIVVEQEVASFPTYFRSSFESDLSYMEGLIATDSSMKRVGKGR